MRHLSRTGHEFLSDGSILRIDFECRHYTAAWYRHDPPHELRMYACGSLEEMCAVAAGWADAFEASLIASPAVVVGDTAAAGDIPGGGQTLKETA